MRATLLLVAVALSGCKTAEVAITHPTTGLHVVARVEAKDASALPANASQDLPAPPTSGEKH
jgi:hypothetical protein